MAELEGEPERIPESVRKTAAWKLTVLAGFCWCGLSTYLNIREWHAGHPWYASAGSTVELVVSWLSWFCLACGYVWKD